MSATPQGDESSPLYHRLVRQQELLEAARALPLVCDPDPDPERVRFRVTYESLKARFDAEMRHAEQCGANCFPP